MIVSSINVWHKSGSQNEGVHENNIDTTIKK